MKLGCKYNVAAKWAALLSISSLILTVVPAVCSAGVFPVVKEGGVLDIEEGRGIGHGKFKLFPSIDFSMYYDSNVFFSDTSPRRDVYTSVKPDFKLRYKLPKLKASVNYWLDWTKYFKNTEQSALSHNINTNFVYNNKRGFYADLSGNIKISPDFADVEVPERIDRTEYGLKTLMGYTNPAKTMDVKAEYRRFAIYYSSPFDMLEKNGHKVDLSGKIRILPKVKGTLDFGFETTDFPNNVSNNLTIFKVLAGFYGMATSKMSITLKGGFMFLDPESSEDSGTFVTLAILNESFTPKTRLRLGYVRENGSSSFSAYKAQDHGLLYYDQKFSRKIQTQLRFDFYNIKYTHTLLGTVSEDRHDQIYRGTFRIFWKLRKTFRIFLEYIGDVRDSNTSNMITGAPSGDFMRHRIGVGFKYAY